MEPLFPRWTRSVFPLGVVVVAAVPLGGVVGLMAWVRSPYVTGQLDPPDQPVQFDHRHHVRDDGIDCEYCHTTARRSPYAGVPPTSLCMGCHNQIWNDSPALALVRQSYFTGNPIPWRRVHRLPDFVFFDHSAHVTRGVACERCHGRVDLMARTLQVAPLTMDWCLDCHRNPGVRDDVHPSTNCSACHK